MYTDHANNYIVNHKFGKPFNETAASNLPLLNQKGMRSTMMTGNHTQASSKENNIGLRKNYPGNLSKRTDPLFDKTIHVDSQQINSNEYKHDVSMSKTMRLH